MNHRYAILGASRGLGRALFDHLFRADPNAKFLLSSRKINEMMIKDFQRTEILNSDFSVVPVEVRFFETLQRFQPTHIIYTAGGGPYGFFQEKKWSDHLWATNVNYLFPAELLHRLAQSAEASRSLRSVTLVGSGIAESNPDPRAASYAASKHALKGLVNTIQAENVLGFQVKLFSPGYMLTDMLPLNSAPRLENKAQSVEVSAHQLAEFIHTKSPVWID